MTQAEEIVYREAKRETIRMIMERCPGGGNLLLGCPYKDVGLLEVWQKGCEEVLRDFGRE